MNAVEIRSFVAGKVLRSAGAELLHVNPSDARDVVAAVPAADPDSVDAAVSAAAAALPAWQRLPGPTRGEYLHRWAGKIEKRARRWCAPHATSAARQ
jgi:acyl-CoA reductase-like NAD-dependent aldehyde dehydrogenase